jgi:hypothetical protein
VRKRSIERRSGRGGVVAWWKKQEKHAQDLPKTF